MNQAETGKTAPQQLMSEFTKLFEQFKLPGIDLNAVLESRRKDIDALAAANRTALEGAQSLAQKQIDVLRTTIDEVQSMLKQSKDTTAPAETLRLGGAGFVSKLSPPERLLEVFAAVAAGDMVFPFVDIHKVRPDPLTSLTHRERDLLAALETGQSNAQLAREFGVSINTVKFHLRNLFGKLDVRNRTQAICLYLETKR